MTTIPTLRFATQAQADISRISGEMAELQRQTASGKSVDELRDLGDGSTRLISTAGFIRMDQKRVSLSKEIEARMQVQATAMAQASSTVTELVRTIREGALNKDGGNLKTALEFAFANLSSSMNETLNGVPVFGGERVGDPPIKIDTLEQLKNVTSKADLYDEAIRKPRVDLGAGIKFDVSETASEISWTTFQSLRDLKNFLDATPEALGTQISDESAAKLIAYAKSIETATNDIRNAESRNGFKLERVKAARTQLENRVLTMTTELSTQSETDLAAVATRLSALETQYQATGQTFATISGLSLLEFLR
jgi:flagellin-like hook-associated protein FlgL